VPSQLFERQIRVIMALPDLSDHGYRVVTPLGQGAEGVVYKAVYIGNVKKGVMEPNQAVAIAGSDPAHKCDSAVRCVQVQSLCLPSVACMSNVYTTYT